jgi:hypothetical protein
MNRRRALGVITTAFLSLLAGCGMIDGDLSVETVEPDTTSAGNLVVHVEVTNTSSRKGSGTLYVEVAEYLGRRVRSRTRQVEVAAYGSKIYDVEFSIDMSESSFEDYIFDGQIV